MDRRIPDKTQRRQILLRSDNVKSREIIDIRPRGDCIDAPPYKDAMGRWRTVSLFFETFEDEWFDTDKDGVRKIDKYTPIFTLREFDLQLNESSPFYERYEDRKIPSLRRLYLEANDPTESRFALEVIKSTFHWKHLCGVEWFKPYLDEWRITLAEKLRAVGIDAIVRIAEGSDPKLGLQAGKWLADGGHTQRRGKGRPSERAVQVEVQREAAIEKIFEDDAKRLGLEVLNEKKLN